MNTIFDSLQHLGLPVCAVDEFARITMWNEWASQFFGLEAKEAIGAEWHTVIHTGRTDGCCSLCKTRRALRNGDAALPVDVTLSIDGQYQTVTMVPMPLDQRGALGFLVVSSEMRTLMLRKSAFTPAQSRVRQLDDDVMIDELTSRERDILACVVDGLDARSIASNLGISHATARNYVQRILTKLGVRNKAEAVNVALTYNLLAS